MRRNLRSEHMKRFVSDLLVHTPLTRMVLLLVVLWLAFSIALYQAEQQAGSTSVHNVAQALYWGVAAFSTAGIASKPESGLGLLIGGTWIIVGSVLFFGAIVATITTYFTRPLQRPHRRIIDTIEYNLEQLNDLSIDELDLLRETVDGLIDHVEKLKSRPGNRGLRGDPHKPA